MSIRVKFLLILLAISIVPMLLLRLNARETLSRTGNELAKQARQTLISSAELDLQRMVEDNAQILERDARLMELSLLYLVSRTEGVLAGSPDRDDPPALMTHAVPDNSPAYCVRRQGECIPLDVDMNTTRILVPMMGMDATATQTFLQNMAPAMRRIKKIIPHLVLWVKLYLDSGGLAVYPNYEADSMPMRHGMRSKGMRMHAEVPKESSRGVSWSIPHIDPVTGKVVFSLGAPFRAPNDKLAGAVVIDMPVSAILHQSESLRKRAPGVESLFIRLDHPTSQVQIIAKEDMQAPDHMRWIATEALETITSDNATAFDAFKIDLARRKSNVRAMPYKGRPSLWAYSPVGTASSLLFILPMKDILVPADKAQNYVINMVDTQLKTTGIILTATIFIVILLGIFVSGRSTHSIRVVANAARRLAAGDFDVRCHIHRRDEIGDMGKAFDDMVPALEDRIRMKEDLSIAEEVQQNLLPSGFPKIKGLDAAARVIYCDETGGDFYDNLELCEENGCPIHPGLGVAVGDVSGHGVPSALLMGSARSFLRARRMLPGSAAEVVSTVNNLIAEDTYETGHFVTMFYAEVLPAPRSIRYVRAGHDPGLLIIPGQDEHVELSKGGPALGLVEGSTFVEGSMEDLPAGTILAIGTDGIWEARSDTGEMYGRERFIKLVGSLADKSANEILEAVYEDHFRFRNGAVQEDDITLVVLKLV